KPAAIGVCNIEVVVDEVRGMQCMMTTNTCSSLIGFPLCGCGMRRECNNVSGWCQVNKYTWDEERRTAVASAAQRVICRPLCMEVGGACAEGRRGVHDWHCSTNKRERSKEER